jgi:hypothetical protein
MDAIASSAHCDCVRTTGPGGRPETYSRDCSMSFLASPSLRYERSTEIDVRCPCGSSPGAISSSLLHPRLRSAREGRNRIHTSLPVHNQRCVPWRLRQRMRVTAKSWRGISLRKHQTTEKMKQGEAYNNAWYSFLAGSVSYRPA